MEVGGIESPFGQSRKWFLNALNGDPAACVVGNIPSIDTETREDLRRGGGTCLCSQLFLAGYFWSVALFEVKTEVEGRA